MGLTWEEVMVECELSPPVRYRGWDLEAEVGSRGSEKGVDASAESEDQRVWDEENGVCPEEGGFGLGVSVRWRRLP